LRDVVVLCSIRRRTAVLSLDKKSQTQALDRTQPGLPMKRGRAGTMTHDYIRHGTTWWTNPVIHNIMISACSHELRIRYAPIRLI
jgi:hypothetical protein